MAELIAFLGVSLAVIVVPGPDFALTLRSTLLGGRRAGLATSAGVAAGQLVWAVAVAAGLATVLAASETLFTLLKLAGAGYLAVLGVVSLRAAFGRDRPVAAPVPRGPALTAGRAFRQGVLSNLGNPKMLAFFTGLLPSFAPGGRPTFAGLLVLGAVFAGLTLVWLSACVGLVDAFRRALARSAVRRTLDGLIGAALIGLGVRVAVE